MESFRIDTDWILRFFFLFVSFTFVIGNEGTSPAERDNELEDYCSAHKFDNLAGGLRFTKEVVTTEYANIGTFKAIHCCLRGYRSIEWYKDDRAYPWPRAVSNFILYPESANQTIYAQVAKTEDAGRYSCRARNDTDTLIGDISLDIVGEDKSGYTGKPLPTYKPISQLVPLGGSARLFCEAYLGRVDLPDARKSVTWARAGSNITVPNQGRIFQYPVSREDDQIVGSYLEIDGTMLEDYGEYECRISNGADDEMTLSAQIYHQEPYMMRLRDGNWRKAMLVGMFVLLLITSAIAFYIRCWLPIATLWHDRFSRLEENDGKVCDALICYHSKDAETAVSTLISNLENKYNFTCATLEISHLNRNWGLEINPHATTVRRVIVLLSSNSLGGNLTNANINGALKQISTLEPKSIVISLMKKLPTTQLTTKNYVCCLYAPLTDELISEGIPILRWGNEEKERYASKFWYKLRLLLPPVRRVSRRQEPNERSGAMIIQSNTSEFTQQIAQSRESLEVLV